MGKIKKIACLVLVFAMAVVPFALTSCDEPGGKDNDLNLENITQLPDSFGGERKDFDGMEFNVLTKTDRTRTQSFNIIDLVGGEDNLGDEAIVTAVENRNARLKSVFGFEVVRTPKSNYVSVARESIRKGDKSYKAYMMAIEEGLNLALEGALVDFNYTTYMDLSADYWDNAVINNLLLYDGAYIALGDINTLDEDCTFCVLFNKFLWEENAHRETSELYSLVKSGKWTMEAMRTFAIDIAIDDTSSSNERYDPEYAGSGIYGLFSEETAAGILIQSSGHTPTVQDESIPVGFRDNMTGNDDFFGVIEEIHKLLGGPNTEEWLLMSHDVNSNIGGDIWETVARGGFKRNRYLFFMCNIAQIANLRDMDKDFGILPMPKYKESQENYTNSLQYKMAGCYVVPSFSYEENEDAAYILEAMCYFSSPAYFEAMGVEDTESLKYAYRINVLERKATRDDESMEMLDLVFENRIFDIVCALDLNEIFADLRATAISDTAEPEIQYALSQMANFGKIIEEELSTLRETVNR